MTATVPVDRERERARETLPNKISLSDQSSFRGIFESELASLTDKYIVTSAPVTTTVLVTTIGQAEISGNDGVLTTIISYSMCYEQLASKSGKTVTSYPSECETYMTLASSRQTLEMQLVAAGIDIQPATLTRATMMQNNKDTNSTATIVDTVTCLESCCSTA